MQLLHWLSIIIEVMVTAMGLHLAYTKKKIYGWGIALTFGIYVIYDLAKFLSLNIPIDLLYFSFFIASLSAFWFIWQLTQLKK